MSLIQSLLARFNARERGLILLAGALIALFALWQFVISPSLSWAHSAQENHLRAQRDHTLISQGVARLNPTDAPSKSAFNRAAVIEIANQTGVTLSRVEPGRNDALRIWLDDSRAANVYSFLTALDKHYKVDITHAQMTRREGNLVAAQFTFSAR